MRFGKNICYFIILISLGMIAQAEEFRIGFEPLPPMITEDGKGLTVDYLQRIAKESGNTFKVTIMTYARAKESLKEGQIELMGHTSFGTEDEEFKKYADEVSFVILGKGDLYTLDATALKAPKESIAPIGAPRGNAEFISQMVGFPMKNLYEGDLGNLLSMLKEGKLKGVFFDRGATMSEIKKMNLANVHYKLMAFKDGNLWSNPLGIAFGKGAKAQQMKAIFTKHGPALDAYKNQLFAEYNKLIELPNEGIVPVK